MGLRQVAASSRGNTALIYRQRGIRLAVLIRDDGRGFEVPERADALSDLGHFGLIGMRERAELIGAHLQIESDESGTSVQLCLAMF